MGQNIINDTCDSRDEARRAEYWERDKARVDALIAASGVVGLHASFDNAEQTITVSASGKRVPSLLKIEAESEIENWPGSRIIGWTEADEPIVSSAGNPNRGFPIDLESGVVGEVLVRDPDREWVWLTPEDLEAVSS